VAVVNAPSTFATALSASVEELLADDISQIVQRTPFIEVAPASVFSPSLVSELADAVDRLAAKVARLTENVS
jgi:hypothetical protein